MPFLWSPIKLISDMLISIVVKKEVAFLTEEKLHNIIVECQNSDNWSKLIRTIGSVYNNPDSMLLSYRKTPGRKSPDHKTPEAETICSKEELRSMEVDEDKDKDEKEADLECDPQSAPDSALDKEDASEDSGSHSNKKNNAESSSLTSCDTGNQGNAEISLDLDSVQRAHAELFAIPGHPFQSALINALTTLSRDMEMDLKFKKAYDADPNYLNIFLIVLEIPTFHSPEYIETAIPLFCKAMGLLPLAAQVKAIRVFATFSPKKLKDYVDSLQQLITVKVITNQWSRRGAIVNDDDGITGAARLLKVKANFLFPANITSVPNVAVRFEKVRQS